MTTPSASHRIRGRRRLSFWLALAAVVHLEAALVIFVVLYFTAPREADLEALRARQSQDEPVEFGLLDDDLARRILADMERDEEKRKEEERKKEEEANKPPGQVVELAKPSNEERPDEARFAAEFDSKVAKESKKYGKLDPDARQGNPSGRDAETSPRVTAQPAQPSPPGRPGQNVPRTLAMRTPGPPSPKAPPANQPGVGNPKAPSGQSNEAEAGPPDGMGSQVPLGRLTLAPMGGGPTMGLPGTAALVPSEQQVARAIGAGTSDHLKGVDDGDETSLNAKKWKHAAFFNRVKRQVREHWNPGEVYRQHDPSFRIYGQADRFTLLKVAIKPDGSLADVELETPSGVEFLDDEAIEAFKQAQPFPNPPRQLIEEGGLISFRFGFYFEIGGAPRMKIFRYDQM